MLAVLVGFAAAVAAGAFTEYWVHRGMHETPLLRRWHARHHHDDVADPWLGAALFFYIPFSLPLFALGFLGGLLFGIGWCAGGIAYTLFMTWCHEQQHGLRLRSWLQVHRRHNLVGKNYGLTQDWLDRAFGTYRSTRQ